MKFSFAPTARRFARLDDLQDGATFILQEDIPASAKGNLATANPPVYMLLDTGSVVDLADGSTQSFDDDTQVAEVAFGPVTVTLVN